MWVVPEQARMLFFVDGDRDSVIKALPGVDMNKDIIAIIKRRHTHTMEVQVRRPCQLVDEPDLHFSPGRSRSRGGMYKPL